jgi:pimeloyl-ACP methyl ester carboxylesterase
MHIRKAATEERSAFSERTLRPISVLAFANFCRIRCPAWAVRLCIHSIQACQLATAIEGVTPAVWRIRLRSVLEVDVTSQLQRIRVPILYLRADEDRVVPAAASDLISRINNSAKVVTIEGPHALLQTNPNACASAIKEFSQQAGLALNPLPLPTHEDARA